MRKLGWIGCFLLLLTLTGCGAAQEETPTLSRVILDRGHGSMWGNQFYMDVCAEEILQTRYFPPDDPGGELTEICGRSIEKEQWEQIVSAVEALEPTLVPKRDNLLKKLLGRDEKSDGTEYRHLTLCWADGAEISYVWPDNEQAQALEALLEQLAAEEG